MITIQTKKDLALLKEKQSIPPPLLQHLEAYFLQLWQNLSEGKTIEQFNLEEHGPIYILEAGDDVRNLASVGLNPEDGGLLASAPNSADLDTLSDNTTVFRIFILCNNEYGITVFSLPGIHDAEVESWLKEQL